MRAVGRRRMCGLGEGMSRASMERTDRDRGTPLGPDQRAQGTRRGGGQRSMEQDGTLDQGQCCRGWALGANRSSVLRGRRAKESLVSCWRAIFKHRVESCGAARDCHHSCHPCSIKSPGLRRCILKPKLPLIGTCHVTRPHLF